MVQYIHELDDWPTFRWNSEELLDPLVKVRHRQGKLIGAMETLGFTLQSEAVLKTITQDVVKSSEIEGEVLDKEQVRSSIARRLGIDIGGLFPADRHVEGIVEMMLDATQQFDKPLTKERLFDWHAAMFPTGRSGMVKITVGDWRTDETGPMQVVSGPFGREKVHYQAPTAALIDDEMVTFLNWFNQEADIDLVLKAGLAHLWFVTLRPFEDGNGRIARAIADMTLARSEKSTQRFYSMSTQIRQERKAYYDILEQTQKGTMDITGWMTWFLECLYRSLEEAETTLSSIMAKARFWEKVAQQPVNQRQQTMINHLFDGFEGKLTTSKWAKITKCSQDTAHRDILDLIERGILVKNPGGGRSTSYSLADSRDFGS